MTESFYGLISNGECQVLAIVDGPQTVAKSRIVNTADFEWYDSNLEKISQGQLENGTRLLVDESECWIAVENGSAATLSTVRFVGGENSSALQPTNHDPIAIKEFDIDDYRVAQMLGNEHPVLVCLPTGHFTWLNHTKIEKLISELMSRQARRDTARDEADKKEVLKLKLENIAHAEDINIFVNPYNFVPFPAIPCQRERPAGHTFLNQTALSGSLTLQWTCTTELLSRGVDDEAGWRPLRTKDDHFRLPGSNVKGVLRSLHETIAGGCLRVLTENFVPVYRDVAKPRERKWTLGIVESVTDGRPTRVQLCNEVVWVESSVLKKGLDKQRINTGDRCTINAGSYDYDHRRSRNEIISDAENPVQEGEDWVILIAPRKGGASDHPFHAAVGRLSHQFGVLSNEAFSQFKRLAEDSEDVTRSRANRPPELLVNYKMKPPKGGNPLREIIGNRQEVRTYFKQRDVAWFKTLSNSASTKDGPLELDGAASSYLWRSEGSGPLGKRVPQSYLACRNSMELCPSCRIFGAADDKTTSSGQSANYKGHIRFGDALSTTAVARTAPVTLAPFGKPRPGAGQFYLQNKSTDAAKNKDDRPTREWGATPDGGGSTLRQMRGRKYYWLGTRTDDQYVRHEELGEQGDGVKTSAELVPAGTVFRSKLHFENLSRSQLGSLLAACEPNLILGPHRPDASWASKIKCEPQPLQVSIGGGKGVGLSQAQPEVLDIQVVEGVDRYRSGSTLEIDKHSLIVEFVNGLSAELKDTWAELAAMLDPLFVNPDRVAYAPEGTWTDIYEKGWPASDKWSATFWKNSSGKPGNGGKFELVEMHKPSELDQYLPIKPNES